MTTRVRFHQDGSIKCATCDTTTERFKLDRDRVVILCPQCLRVEWFTYDAWKRLYLDAHAELCLTDPAAACRMTHALGLP